MDTGDFHRPLPLRKPVNPSMDEKTKVFFSSIHRDLPREVDDLSRRLAPFLVGCEEGVREEILARFTAMLLSSVKAIEDKSGPPPAPNGSPDDAPSEGK